jgi:hypothetical protein
MDKVPANPRPVTVARQAAQAAADEASDKGVVVGAWVGDDEGEGKVIKIENGKAIIVPSEGQLRSVPLADLEAREPPVDPRPDGDRPRTAAQPAASAPSPSITMPAPFDSALLQDDDDDEAPPPTPPTEDTQASTEAPAAPEPSKAPKITPDAPAAPLGLEETIVTTIYSLVDLLRPMPKQLPSPICRALTALRAVIDTKQCD